MTGTPEEATVVEQPEVHHPHVHHRGGLPRWLELVIALTALVTSVSSIVIAMHHGEVMEKLVQANSLPFMQGGFSDATEQGEEILSLDLFNRGVGPAYQQSLRLSVDGKTVKSVRDLVAAAIGPELTAEAARKLDSLQNRVPKRYIPAGQQQFVFRIRKTPENAVYWDHLQGTQTSWNVEFCYCSVFDECWRVPGKWEQPVKAAACPRDEATEFVP